MAKKTTRKTTSVNESAETDGWIKIPGPSTSAWNYYANNRKAREAAAARFDARLNRAEQTSKTAGKAQRASRGT
jgi:hypothetical protein